jgi:hypothetical protein
MDASAPLMETVLSNPSDADLFAQSNPRRYYFDSEAKAVASAKKRAMELVNALKPWLCK